MILRGGICVVTVTEMLVGGTMGNRFSSEAKRLTQVPSSWMRKAGFRLCEHLSIITYHVRQ